MKEFVEILKNNKWAILAWFGLMVVSTTVKIGFLVGCETATLSLGVATLPVIAYFFPGRIALPLAAAAWMCTHLSWPVPLTLGIPSLFATLSWSLSKDESNWKNTWLHIILPLACMTLFYVSPVGEQAWPYSLFWLIPVISCMLPLGIVGRALKSSFVAHAIGSVIWVYLIPITAETWINLIPVVAVERLFTVSWSLIMIGALSYVKAEFWSRNPVDAGYSTGKALQR